MLRVKIISPGFIDVHTHDDQCFSTTSMIRKDKSGKIKLVLELCVLAWSLICTENYTNSFIRKIRYLKFPREDYIEELRIILLNGKCCFINWTFMFRGVSGKLDI